SSRRRHTRFSRDWSSDVCSSDLLFAMVIFRAYRKQLVFDLELDQDRWHRTPEWLFRCRISWEPLLSARAARRKLKVAEISGSERSEERRVGKEWRRRWGGESWRR